MTISATTRGLRPGVCTSSTRPSSPFDGQLIYETDTNRVAVYDTNAWVYKTPASTTGSVLQVVSTTKTDTFSVTSSTFTDVTGLTATITPGFSSSKIIVFATTMVAGESGVTNAYVRIARAGTGIAVGDTVGSNRVFATAIGLATNLPYSIAVSTLDSPNTTSSTTYSIQVRNQGSGAIHLNRPNTDSDVLVNGGRFSSSITVMEIAQ